MKSYNYKTIITQHIASILSQFTYPNTENGFNKACDKLESLGFQITGIDTDSIEAFYRDHLIHIQIAECDDFFYFSNFSLYLHRKGVV